MASQCMQELAEVEDAATEAAFQEAVQGPVRDEDEVPTKPATSPSQVDPQAREWLVQLRPVQGRVFGPQEEPNQSAMRVHTS